MILNEQKDKLLADMHNDIQTAVRNSMGYLSLDNGPMSISGAIERAIVEGVKAGIGKLIDKTYSTQDFEQDLGLRDKP
jgi:hypothetical protein